MIAEEENSQIEPSRGQVSQVQSVISNNASTLAQSNDVSQDRQSREGNNHNGVQIRPLVVEDANDLAFERNPSIFISRSQSSK